MKVSKKLLIAGGSGFFGQAILSYIKEHREASTLCNFDEVCIFSRNPKSILEVNPELAGLSWVKFVTGDVLNFQTFPLDKKFSHIIHAASSSVVNHMSYLEQYDQIVSGTENLLKYAKKVEAQHFLLCSSGGVYGSLSKFPDGVDEDYFGIPNPLDERSVYGIAKRQAEHLSTLYFKQYGVPVKIARCFAFVGADLPFNAHFAIGNFIRDAMSAESLVVNGDGTPLRTYLYQDDLAFWLLKILEMGITGEAYNVGSDEIASIFQVAQRVRDVIAPSKKIVVLKPPNHNLNVYVPNISKAKFQLGLRVKIDLTLAIEMTYNKLKARKSHLAR